MAQATVVLGANLHVHYAAFAAARCAIVQVPADYSAIDNEGPNVVVNSASGYKLELIREAAVYALAPVSGNGGSADSQVNSYDTVNGASYVAALTKFYQSYNQSTPTWVANVIAGRVRYADANTTVILLDGTALPPTPLMDNPHTYGPVDPVAVQVTHKLNLALPLGIARLFEGPNGGHEGNWTYCTLTAHSMLTNQGVPTALPPAPPIPRQP
jgi:hypothetical protein